MGRRLGAAAVLAVRGRVTRISVPEPLSVPDPVTRVTPPPRAEMRSRIPVRPAPSGVWPPFPSSDTSTPRLGRAVDADAGVPGVGVAQHVGDRFAHRECQG